MTNAAVIAATLWPVFRKLILRIGRWVIGRIRRWGSQKVAVYMRMRAEDVFEARLGRARAKWRKKWLRGRIKRWVAIADWLEDKENGKKVNTKVADALEDLAIGERIPKVAPWEKKAA
jgi:hypothetical protein